MKIHSNQLPLDLIHALAGHAGYSNLIASRTRNRWINCL